MSKTIVSCAPSGVGKGPNYGMLTVDLAIHNIIKSLPATSNIICSAPWPAFSENYPDAALRDRVNFPEHIQYDLYAMNNLKAGDRVLFWGDFQWGRDYQIQSAARLQNHIAPGSSIPHLRIVQERFLLKKLFENQIEHVEIMSYGTTLFQNRLYDYMEQEYLQNLHWLLKKASYIKFRDAFSAQYCAGVRGDFEHSYQGVDAALLNTRHELLQFETGDIDFVKAFEGQVGYYFGRSSSAFPSLKVARFLGNICRDFNKKLIKVPWTYFTKGLFNDSMDKYLQFTFAPILRPPTERFVATDVLKAMDACAIIITDTYHLAINAIALHKPVFIIPEFRSSSHRDANMGYIGAWRDKRVMLFMTNALADLMINPDLCGQKHYKKTKTEIINLMLTRPELTTHLYAHIHTLASADRATITHLLSHS